MESGTNDYDFSFSGIRKNQIFNSLDDEKLGIFLQGFTLEKWKKNVEFIDSINTQRKFYIILKGRIKTYQINTHSAREFTLFLLTENDVFDVISLLDGKKHTANFKSLDAVQVLSAPIEHMRLWVEQHPEINKTLLPYLANRMRALETNLTDNVLSDIPTRLAKLILQNIDASSMQLQLINDLSNEEIASLVGSTRAVINRHIQNFKKAGIIDTDKRRTRVKDIKALVNKIEGSNI